MDDVMVPLDKAAFSIILLNHGLFLAQLQRMWLLDFLALL